MLKDIIIPLALDAADTARDYALSLASLFDAHVTGVAFAFDPVMPPALMGGIPVEYITEQKQQNAEAAARAVKRFEDAARQAGTPFDCVTLDAGFAEAGSRFAALARRFDLAIANQPRPDSIGVDELIIEGVLFESGRPLLIIPAHHLPAPALTRALVAWDGGAQAARALHDALPLLLRAEKVQVLSFSTSADLVRELAPVDLAHHLARHGLNADAKSGHAPDGDISKALVAAAIDVNADLMVMGGYGHSRLRQFILGGTTRGILAKMTVPVLMSH